MKLYYSPGTCSMAVWITLEWAQADYEVEKVELGSEEYKKINPSGTVPAIDSGEGKLKTQLPALIQYINRLYPEANLGPDEGPEAIYEYEEILAFLSSDIHPLDQFLGQVPLLKKTEKKISKLSKMLPMRKSMP